MEEICECQEVHKLSTKKVVVSHDAFRKLVDFILESDFKKVTVIYQAKNEIIIDLKNRLSNIGVFIEVKNASVFEAEKLEGEDEDIVLAFGDEKAISVAKYYAYTYSKPLVIYPIGNFLDFTFSKFSRLFDGVEYGFYDSAEPEYIFVSLKDNMFNSLQSYFLSSKYIALFDSIVSERVYGSKNCQRMRNFFKKTLDTYSRSRCYLLEEKNIVNIWTLIRLGEAMTFYGQTKFFYGGDRAVVDRLNMIRPNADYIELEVIALKLIINSYSCFYSSPSNKADVNLNKHIDAMARVMRLSPSMVMRRLVDSKLLMGDMTSFGSYYPYLKAVLNKVLSRAFSIQASIDLNFNPVKKYSLKANSIEKCFALSSDLYASPCTLHLLTSYGFMDKLL